MAMHTLAPRAFSGDSILVPARRRQRIRHPFKLSRRRRERIEALIERLLSLLNAADGDPDLEPDVIEEDDREGTLQPPVTPDSTRPTLPMVWWG